MKLTDALLGEHGAFYALFDEIEEIAATEDAMAQWRGATTVLEAMVTSHEALEERLLFAALRPHLGNESGPLAVLHAEHEEMERFLAHMQQEPDVDRAILWISEALGAARRHFKKEEQILFPLAQRILGDEALIRMGRDWAEARRVTIG